MVCLQSFCLEFLLLFLLSCFSRDMMCLQRFFVFVLFSFSKLYSFKLERIQHNINNINILSRLELYYYLRVFFLIHVFCFVFVWFLRWGWGGALAFMKKTGVWGSILLTIYICTSLLHLVFPFPPTLIAVSECDVLWTATCTVISLVGSVKSRLYF